MLAEIAEDVGESVSHLARRRERSAEPSIGPERALAIQESVDVARDADGDAAEAGGQSSLVARFDDEVEVIALNGEVDDPEAIRTVGKTCWLRSGRNDERSVA